jgi:hypothetical protein
LLRDVLLGIALDSRGRLNRWRRWCSLIPSRLRYMGDRRGDVGVLAWWRGDEGLFDKVSARLKGVERCDWRCVALVEKSKSLLDSELWGATGAGGGDKGAGEGTALTTGAFAGGGD